ncbi:MAG: 2OG-Fe(II) oxygenase [Bacteroidota bacterium]
MQAIANALNTAAINEAAIPALRESFATAKPYNYMVIENFLREDIANDLYEHFPKMTDLRKHYKGLNENKSEGSSFDTYHGSFAKVLDAIKSAEFTRWLEQIVQIDDLLLPDDHRGAGVHQGKNGSFLDVHVDFSVHPILNMHRRLNLLIFLNKDWKQEYGGHLELWNEDVTVLEKEIMPTFNRAVVFQTTDTSYHGYDVINIPEGETRKSIYSYYYSPLGEGVKYHDTIFKPRPSDTMMKKAQTNAKETVKNGIKRTIQRMGLKGIFERFE